MQRGAWQFPALASVLQTHSLLSQHGEVEVFSWALRNEDCVFSDGHDFGTFFVPPAAIFGQKKKKNASLNTGANKGADEGSS